jgi:hypothetical protein
MASEYPKVFISYSHDSREHCDQVLAFAQQLRRDGIDAELDQFHQDELVHWPRFAKSSFGRKTPNMCSAFAPPNTDVASKTKCLLMSVRGYFGRRR